MLVCILLFVHVHRVSLLIFHINLRINSIQGVNRIYFRKLHCCNEQVGAEICGSASCVAILTLNHAELSRALNILLLFVQLDVSQTTNCSLIYVMNPVKFSALCR